MNYKKMVAFGASLALMLPAVSSVRAVAPVGSVISASASDTYNDESDFTFSYDTENKTATLVKYVGTATDVVIPPTVQNGKFTVTTIGTKAFYDTSKTLTSIQIPESVVSIGDYAIGVYRASGGKYSSDVGEYCSVNNSLKVTCASIMNEDVLFEYASRDFIVSRGGFITTEYDKLTFKYDTDNMTASIIKYYGEDADLTIPATINDRYNVTGIEDYAIGIYKDSGGTYESALSMYCKVYNNLQIYYSNPDIETALLNYVSNDYITSRGGLKMPILLGSEDVTTTETDDPYANCIFDVNQDGDINSVDLLLLKKKILQMI